MRITVSILLFASLAFFQLFLSPGLAYQEMGVENGGVIKGKAFLTGRIPPPRIYHEVLFPNMDLCAEVDTDENMNRVLNDFLVYQDGGLKDVVISIEHVDAGKVFQKESVRILSKDCKFSPTISVVRQGETIHINNVDPVMHNSQVYESKRGKIISNLPIPAEETSSSKIKFSGQQKIFQLICGMHEFMQAWGYRVQNPYYSVTSENGAYQINDLPPGDYVINAWHFLMKVRSQRIHVEENSVIDLDFNFDGNEVVRPHYETIVSGRIKEEAFESREKVLQSN
jgi:plastocyanin